MILAIVFLSHRVYSYLRCCFWFANVHPAYLWQIILQNTGRQLYAHTYCSFTCLHVIAFK